MSTLKNVANKLFKTEVTSEKVELESHKVELALIDDLTKSLNKSKISYKEFNDSYNKFADFKRLVILQGEQYSKDGEDLISLYEKAAMQAKELGLDFNSTNVAKEVRNLIANGDPNVIKKTVNNLK
jgi:hypothetical protein